MFKIKSTKHADLMAAFNFDGEVVYGVRPRLLLTPWGEMAREMVVAAFAEGHSGNSVGYTVNDAEMAVQRFHATCLVNPLLAMPMMADAVARKRLTEAVKEQEGQDTLANTPGAGNG